MKRAAATFERGAIHRGLHMLSHFTLKNKHACMYQLMPHADPNRTVNPYPFCASPSIASHAFMLKLIPHTAIKLLTKRWTQTQAQTQSQTHAHAHSHMAARTALWYSPTPPARSNSRFNTLNESPEQWLVWFACASIFNLPFV